MSKKSRKRKPVGEVSEFARMQDDIEQNIKQNQIDTHHHNFKLKHDFKFNPRQVEVFKSMIDNNTKMVFIDGPAGSAKTYIAAYASLQLLKNNEIEQILYIRSAVESASRSLGFLPGEIEEKFSVYLVPLQEKMQELLEEPAIKALTSNKIIEAVPINYARGRTFKNCAVIIDEAQNLSQEELKTAITRFGVNCKIFVIGDTQQADIGHKSGFARVVAQFDRDVCRDRGFHSFKLTSQDIVRSPELSFIIDVLNSDPIRPLHT